MKYLQITEITGTGFRTLVQFSVVSAVKKLMMQTILFQNSEYITDHQSRTAYH